MAKRKAKKTTTRRRKSRKIGAVDTNAVVGLVAAGAGYLAANMLDKVIPINNPMLKNGGKLAVALLVPKFIKGPTGVAFAMGVGANAVSKTLVGFMPSLGATDDDVVMIQGINTIGEDAEYAETLSGINTIGSNGTIGSVEEYLHASGVM